MLLKIKLSLLLFISVILISCHNKKDAVVEKQLSQQEIKERLLEINQASIQVENKQIDTLVTKSGWNMTETGTGLRYQILEKGNGPIATSGKIASLEYEVKLISGEVIYSSDKTGPKEFRIGKGGVESGLEEGILLLRVGDKARLIMPSYLAEGLAGDQDKIPPKATLIYTIKLIELK